MELQRYLKYMVDHEGSDLYLNTDAAPSCKIMGKLTPIEPELIKKNFVKDIAYTIMNEEQIKDFEKNLEMNIALQFEGVGRFRINIFIQRSEVALVARHIRTDIPNMDDMKLPSILKQLIMEKRGLILFVGGTGSGKSTSLAAMIDYRNTHSSGHIITIEDPVEFVHPNKKSIVSQREVGVDTHSYENALKNTLRQAPDVILIGEIRSQETMEHALAFAETGHLCVSTLHANNANQALDRIVNFFPEERHKQLFQDLSLNIRGIVSQRLVPTVDSKRAAAIEILTGSPIICELIKKGDIQTIKEIMEKAVADGMQTFDLALYQLYKDGRITLDEALKNADSANNLRLRISLDTNGQTTTSTSSTLTLQDKKPEKKEENKEEKKGQ